MLPRQLTYTLPLTRLGLIKISRPLHASAAFSVSKTGLKREGSKSEDHVTENNDSHNVQKDASKSGQQERAKGGSNSQAMSEADHGNQNAKAKKDHPEAPGPVLGMNDERGGKGR